MNQNEFTFWLMGSFGIHPTKNNLPSKRRVLGPIRSPVASALAQRTPKSSPTHRR